MELKKENNELKDKIKELEHKCEIDDKKVDETFDKA